KDGLRNILLVDVDLLEQRGVKLTWVKRKWIRLRQRRRPRGLRRLLALRQLFPEELAPINDLAATHVEEIHGKHVILIVVADDVSVIAFRRGDALLLLYLVNGGNQVTILRCQLKILDRR